MRLYRSVLYRIKTGEVVSFHNGRDFTPNPNYAFVHVHIKPKHLRNRHQKFGVFNGRLWLGDKKIKKW